MLKPSYEESTKFLERWAPGGPWVLTAISLDKKSIDTRTFRESNTVRSWLEVVGADRNVYFHVNPVRRDLQKKAEREDVAALAWLHVDIDPRAGEDPAQEQRRALALLQEPPGGVPKPTVVVFSGGGYQGFWELREPMTIDGEADYEEAARYNQQLELLFGADNCHNVDRIMRLPGTINRPDARKRRKGRQPALSTLVEWADGRVYDLSQFTPAPKVQRGDGVAGAKPGVKVSGNVQRIDDVDQLPDAVPALCKVVIVQGFDPDDPQRFPSRSEALFYVCCELVRAGCDDDTIYAVVTDPDFKISSSVLDKGSSAQKYALRQIERAREDAIDPHLREMNEKHAIIGSIGGKCRVISEVYDHTLDRIRIDRQTFDDIRNRYARIKVQIGQNAQGDPIFCPRGKWWLEHPSARYYDYMVFAPGREVEGAYNLWRGFACEAIPGECSRYLEHLHRNLCGGSDEHYQYLLDWMASAVQRPHRPGQVAVVVRGRMGTGKGFFARIFGSLFGRHFLQVSDPKHLVGHFNAHLRDCVLLFGDEAFYAGDNRHASVLKTLITEPMLAIEAKGVDVEPSGNCVHLIMASNEQWVVPAGLEERRFFVLDVAPDHIQDSEYFGLINEEMAQGGREALLHTLLSRDLSAFSVWDVPKTAALQEQKLLSMSPEEEWWYQKLRDGRVLPEDEHWRAEVYCEELLADYVHYTRQFNIARRGNATRLGHFLKRCMPRGTVDRIQKRESVTLKLASGEEKIINRPYAYLLPELWDLRAHWDDQFGGPYQWPEVGVDEEGPDLDYSGVPF